jgi:hypothetical protein
MLSSKAAILYYIHFSKEKENIKDINPKSKIVLNQYQIASDETDCLSKTTIKYYRYNFLSRLIYQYNKELDNELTILYKEAKSELKSIGLKPERDGFGLGIHSSHGKENWIGIDFSIASYFKGVTQLKSNCDGDFKSYRPSNIVVHSMNAFVFSYSKGLKSKTNDFSFSLFELNAPLTFVPMRFGIQTKPGSSSKNIYYRPGFGLSIGMVSVSYSYNVMFSKAKRRASEKLLLDFRIIYPIVNYRYRTKRI